MTIKLLNNPIVKVINCIPVIGVCPETIRKAKLPEIYQKNDDLREGLSAKEIFVLNHSYLKTGLVRHLSMTALLISSFALGVFSGNFAIAAGILLGIKILSILCVSYALYANSRTLNTTFKDSVEPEASLLPELY